MDCEKQPNENYNKPALRLVLRTGARSTLYIKLGSPWENGYIKSFHDKLRGECLNRELFSSLFEAQIIFAGVWRVVRR